MILRTPLLKRAILLAGCALLATEASAQRRWLRNYKEAEFSEARGYSLGINVGLSDLWGDVGTRLPTDHYANDNYWDNPTFMGGLYIRYASSPALAFRLQASYGRLYAHDNFNENKARNAETFEEDAVQRYLRNQDTRTRVWEGLFMAEISPRRFNPQSASARKSFQPYLSVGFGAMNFNPQTTWKSRPGTGGAGYGQWVDIYDLDLEGQGLPTEAYKDAPPEYDRWQLVIPLGAGLRWDLGTEVSLGLEYNYRYMFTDYLDGVSDRYVDPALFDVNLNPERAVIAKDVYDKTFQVLPGESRAPGELRGNKSVNDGYSTISINFFYKVNNRKSPWWLPERGRRGR